jgi:hypothetical protein
MRLEILPLVLGVVVGLIGLGLVFDAWAPDHVVISSERRRRPRRGRDRGGEALVGLGVIALAAALLGRDTWRYTTVAVIAGAVLLLWGLKRSGSYVRGIFARGDVSPPKVAEGPRRIR